MERQMTLNVPGEYKNVLSDAVARGAFPSMENALRHALELFAEEQRAKVDTMQNHLDIDELARQQGIRTFDAKERAPEGLWPTDEVGVDFIAFVKQSRNDDYKDAGQP